MIKVCIKLQLVMLDIILEGWDNTYKFLKYKR